MICGGSATRSRMGCRWQPVAFDVERPSSLVGGIPADATLDAGWVLGKDLEHVESLLRRFGGRSSQPAAICMTIVRQYPVKSGARAAWEQSYAPQGLYLLIRWASPFRHLAGDYARLDTNLKSFHSLCLAALILTRIFHRLNPWSNNRLQTKRMRAPDYGRLWGIAARTREMTSRLPRSLGLPMFQALTTITMSSAGRTTGSCPP